MKVFKLPHWSGVNIITDSLIIWNAATFMIKEANKD